MQIMPRVESRTWLFCPDITSSSHRHKHIKHAGGPKISKDPLENIVALWNILALGISILKSRRSGRVWSCKRSKKMWQSCVKSPSFAKSDLNLALQPNGYRSLHLVAERHGQPFEASLQVQKWPK